MNTDLINKGIEEIFAGDKRRLDEVLGGQGWRYFAAAICIFPLTLFKVFHFLHANQHLFIKPKMLKQQHVEDSKGIGLSSFKLKQYSNYIFTSGLEDYNNEAVPSQPVESEVVEYVPSKLEAVQSLQALFDNNVRLTGSVLKVTHHKVSDEALLEGAETGMMNAKYMTQRVTFGNETNKTLKTVFPLLKLRNLKGSTDTYFVFENDEVFELERKLRNTFMKPVTIVLGRN